MYWEEYPLKIQAYDSRTDAWYHKEFQDKDEFTTYCQNQVKLPGQYNLQNVKVWQKEGLQYASTCTRPNFEGGWYTRATEGSHGWKVYWNNEKDKVLKGVIFDGVYVPPFYYWYLNYCPIFDAVLKKKTIGKVWDSDLWFFQLIMVGMLTGKHICVVKARQRGYSFKIMALQYWCYSWFEASVNTIGATKEEYVAKSWRFLEYYRKHINANTAWVRGPLQAKHLDWLERTATADGGYVGLDSKLTGTTFKTSPSNGVGGSQSIFFYEEAGIAPTLLETIGFVRPALERGTSVSGLIICSGSVGELEHCEGLKEIFYRPEAHNFLAIKNVWDKDPEEEMSGIFVSEAYNLEGFIDSNGNSLVEEATAWVEVNKEKVKNSKKAELAQLDISQKPLSPEDAFAQRKTSFFPVEKIQRRQEVIKIEKGNGKQHGKKGILKMDGEKIVFVPLSEIRNNPPVEMGYPVKPEMTDKRGLVTIYVDPDKEIESRVNFAGVDTVEAEGATSTSESLFSIYIVSRVVEVHYTDEEGHTGVRMEGGNLLASWTGRYDDIEDTNEQGELLIRLYNAYAAVERNKPNFINHFRRKGLAIRHLIKRKELQIYRDADLTGSENDDYGIYFGGDSTGAGGLGKAEKILMDTIKEDFLRTVDVIRKKNADGTEGEVVKTIRGLDLIDDYYLLQEAKEWRPGKNADRLRAYGLAKTASMCYEATSKKKIYKKAELLNPEPIRTKPINLLGGYSKPSQQTKRKIRLI